MRPRSATGVMLMPALFGLIGLAATIAAMAAFIRLSDARIRLRVDRTADRATDRIEDCVQANISLLHGAAGFFSASEEVTSQEFSRFAGHSKLTDDHPGTLGMAFIQWCRTAADADKLSEEISRRTSTGVGGRKSQAPEQALVKYLEPAQVHSSLVLGSDTWSNPQSREALERARDTGAAAATAPLPLSNSSSAQGNFGFIIFVPVYEGGGIPAASDDRRRAISGWVCCLFRIDDLMKRVFRHEFGDGISISISDAASGQAGTIMYTSAVTSEPLTSVSPRRIEMSVAGRKWAIESHALSELRGVETPMIIGTGVCGVLLTGALMWISFSQNRNRRLEAAAAEQLARSAERYSSLVAATSAIVWISDADGRFTQPQQSWEAFTGRNWEEHKGRGWLEAIHAADRERLIEAWDRAKATRTHFEIDGRIWHSATRAYRWFIMRGVPMLHDGRLSEWVGLVQDIQERRQLEESLLQSRKLESLGRLAGGISHDFNNLLTAIIGSADLAATDPGLSATVKQYLQTIRDAASRSGVLTGHLLAFARKRVIEPRNVAVNDLVKGLSTILRRLLGENIQLLTSLGETTGRTRIDPGQFEQVLVNLATNARDAMPGGGVLTIQTSNVELDDEYARTHNGSSPGRYVMVLVSDTGIGMEESVQAHIFEPFFTTKENGKGTGLGLATCYGIIKQAGGSIWVYSEPGKGTLFRIFLPRCDAQDDAEIIPVDETPVFGTETVLLVEDEPMVRQIATAALRGYGYNVMPASSAEEALALANSYSGDIHLLLTDVVLPQQSGKDLADQLRVRRPGIRVLFCSGYTDNIISQHGVLHDGVLFLQKPYTPRQVARKVRTVLDSVPSRAAK